jgi:hypothetical protein
MGQWFKSSKAARRNEGAGHLVVTENDTLPFRWQADGRGMGGSALMEESLVTTYRKNASYCRVKAARADDDAKKAKWLEFADSWEQLADKIARESSQPSQTLSRSEQHLRGEPLIMTPLRKKG